MTIEPFATYQLYQSIKLHFESDSYDAVKYNYKTSAKPQSFWKRKDKYFFAKLGNRLNSQNDLVQYLVANFVRDTGWIGEMLEDTGQKNYQQHQKIHQSMSYFFREDISKLADKYDSLESLLKAEQGSHPAIIKELLQQSINIETVVVLDKMTGFMSDANKKITETMVWPDLYRKLSKYRSFVYPELQPLKKIVLDSFEN